MSRLNYYSGGWKNLPDGTRFKYYDNGWKNPNKVAVYDGSQWVTVWNKSDPVTYSYYTWFDDNLRHGTSNAWTTTSDNLPYIGRFGGTYPYHFAGVLSLGSPTDGNSAHNADTIIATRPVIKSISLRLTRHSTSAGVSSPTGNMNIGTMSYPVASWGSGTMTTVSSTFDFSPVTTYSVNGWGFGVTKTIDIEPQHGYDMINSQRALIMSEVTSGYTTSGSSTNAYMKFWGNGDGDSVRPMFTITFDYV